MSETKGEYNTGQEERFDLQVELRKLETGYLKLDQAVDSFSPFNPSNEYNRRRVVIDQIEKRITAEFTALREQAEQAEAEVARLREDKLDMDKAIQAAMEHLTKQYPALLDLVDLHNLVNDKFCRTKGVIHERYLYLYDSDKRGNS